jgi:Domain of unknown function (DUF5666)
MNRIPVISRRQAAALMLALSAAALTACGGGGDAAVGAGPTETPTAYAAGPITGFGSVIVNGVRYDDSAASVIDDDDGGHSRDELKLGMMVEVDGSQMDRANGLGKALRIRFGSEIVGPLASVSANGSSLVVLGQTVLVNATTVFDDMPAGGLSALVGTPIEVHAQFNAATGDYTATRIEPEADAQMYKLRGVVADLNPTDKTFTLGGEVINFADIAAADLPNNLANGLKVRVRLKTEQVDGQWVAVSVRHGVRKVEDRDDAHLRGTISALRSATDFDVNGLKVNATTASFPDGTAGVVLGAEVEVEGAVVDGVLVATKVELDDERHAGDRHRFELHGLISELNKEAKSFSLRGVTVSYAGNVSFEDGFEADLANGAKVEVKGTPSADRTTLVASSIEFED